MNTWELLAISPEDRSKIRRNVEALIQHLNELDLIVDKGPRAKSRPLSRRIYSSSPRERHA
jgi:hypothetical protein